ncbi:MAG: carboxypeptidase-like regulatory domain-containing protein, partial [Candidatus Marinimicrobia bacterium]|nr:carboxypeptidase-like regulatory domain-containing protein [Candidatus Neomarinimicrobiota bacterium]
MEIRIHADGFSIFAKMHSNQKHVNIMKLIIAYISITLAICNVSFAGTTGKIVGRVLDETTGQPLPGANLILKGTGMGAAADFGGNFIILNIPPGTYTLTARMIGYQAVDYENVRVTIDLTTTINFDMGVQAIESGEVVTVIGKAPLVRMDLTSSSVSVSAEQIAVLPVNDFLGIVNLQAGVVDGHFRGGRGGEVLYLVDGIPVNDVFSGDLAFQVENNAIQEMEIISGTFNAEYGQVQSGVVNVVTKEGGQKYTGQISSYIGDYVTGNNDIFENIDDRSPTAIFDLKGSLSGPIPIFREHLTFYVSGRNFHDEGHLYGKTVYNPSVTTNVTDVLPQSEWKYQSMNQIDRKSFQGKLTYVIDPKSKKDKINFDIFKQNIENKGANFDHLFRFSPDGMATQFKDSWSIGTRWSR